MSYEGPINKTEYALMIGDVIWPMKNLQVAEKIYSAAHAEPGMEGLQIVKRQVIVAAWSRYVAGEPIVKGPKYNHGLS